MLDRILQTELFSNSDLLLVIALIYGILVFASLLFFVLSKVKPSLNLEELISRTKSWWVMATIFIMATMLSNDISYIALSFLAFVAFRELYSILGFRDSDRRAILWAYLAIPVQFFLAYIEWYGAFIIFIPVIMFLLLPLRFAIKGDVKGILKSISYLQWILMLSVFGISHLAYMLSLPDIPQFKAGGRGLLLFIVFLTEFNDIMQFTWGKLLGKKKIIPLVSPNKTLAGFLGGLISTLIVGYFLGFLTPLEGYQLVFACFLIGFAGFSGDIVMSAVKRDIGVKDTGNVIPGHGGILDRIDSLAYTAPAFFHFVYYLAY